MTLSNIMLLASLILGALLAAIPHLLWLIASLIGRLFRYSIPYAPFGWTALGLVLFCWLLLAYGFFFGRWQLKTTHLDFADERIPAAFEGYRIVHISDLHLSTFDDQPQRLDHLVDSINALHPDLICFTGDLVTMGREEALPYTTTLRRLQAKDGVISILGNHDFLIYNPALSDNNDRHAAVKVLAAYERDMLGWHLLRNEHIVLRRGADSITIEGVDNCNCSGQGFQTINVGDLSAANTGTSGFKILLTHDPSHWEAEVLNTDIALTLSGHTHASQVTFFGWNPASRMFREYAGFYQKGTQAIYVNAGLGCTLPVRIACPEEITVITLKNKR